MVIAPADVAFGTEIAEIGLTIMLPVFVPDPSTKMLWPLTSVCVVVTGQVMRMSEANAFEPPSVSRAAVTALT